MAVDKDLIIDRKPFDVQEAVILLDVYLFEKSNKLKRTEAAKIASERLRNFAAKRGMTISASFRSPMGLQNRLRSIGGLFEGKESVSAPGTDAFREAVDLYNNDHQRYQQLLYDAGFVSSQGQDKKPAKARTKTKIVHTRFVRTKKDQKLKDKYSSDFNDVYYALKHLTEKGISTLQISMMSIMPSSI